MKDPMFLPQGGKISILRCNSQEHHDNAAVFESEINNPPLACASFYGFVWFIQKRI